MHFLLIFIAIPMIELWLIFRVAGWVGGFETIFLLLLTAAIGITLLRGQGMTVLERANHKWQVGGVPAQELIEGLMLAFGGLLLLLPGFLSDGIGFLMLIPPVRSLMAARMVQHGFDSFLQGFSGQPGGRFVFRRRWRWGSGSGASGDFKTFGGRIYEGSVTETTYAANDGDKLIDRSDAMEGDVVGAIVEDVVEADDNSVVDGEDAASSSSSSTTPDSTPSDPAEALSRDESQSTHGVKVQSTSDRATVVTIDARARSARKPDADGAEGSTSDHEDPVL